jgi:hypothetical protein
MKIVKGMAILRVKNFARGYCAWRRKIQGRFVEFLGEFAFCGRNFATETREIAFSVQNSTTFARRKH